MKTTIIAFLTLITISCAPKPEDQKFVNPIFYKVMEPLSTPAWQTQITPNEMVSSNKGDVIRQKCTLIENTMDAVTLQCEGPYESTSMEDCRFVLVPDNKDYHGMLVRQYEKRITEKRYTSELSLIIHAED